MDRKDTEMIIEKSLRTGLLIDGFWDRWLVHGLESSDLTKIRSRLNSIGQWIDQWVSLAMEIADRAKKNEIQERFESAEMLYRQSSLYYNLAQWIFPAHEPEKEKWYLQCQEAFRKADRLSSIDTQEVHLPIADFTVYGRIRIPSIVEGVVLIINPIDSTKEELFLYEQDFLRGGMATISFDGPGQGSTYILDGTKGSQKRWIEFIDGIIEFTAQKFTGLPIHLFGTSLGASWVIYGSCHPLVSKAVSVSPVVERDKLHFPYYFNGRLTCMLISDTENAVPPYQHLTYQSPVQLFVGQQDGMVPQKYVEELFKLLPKSSKMRIYPDEGHCCNSKLQEIREFSIRWFREEKERQLEL